MALLQSESVRTVHFVDVVQPLIETVEQTLTKHYPLSSHWQVHCSDLNTLKLPNDNARHLLIIAGVGGDLTIKLVRNLLENNPYHNIELLLCPVRHNFSVRQAMAELGLGLINESLVCEKGLFYEVIHIASGADQVIETTGSLMWNFSDAEHQRYLKQNIEHYQRAARSNPAKYTDILYAYQTLKRQYV